ncbi:alcohol dehydrogenase catalytic domain-containing protein [Salmonella enterica subsp. enterica]|nr:alcohol dehydrogenase catalytic domain-containing protein [Salmonella enterica subsp. enterica]
MVVGHEYVGEVVGIGQEVKALKSAIASPANVSPAVITRNCRGGRTHLCRNTTGVNQPSRPSRNIWSSHGVQCV